MRLTILFFRLVNRIKKMSLNDNVNFMTLNLYLVDAGTSEHLTKKQKNKKTNTKLILEEKQKKVFFEKKIHVILIYCISAKESFENLFKKEN